MYEDEPVLGEKQANIKLKMADLEERSKDIKTTEDLVNYLKYVVDKFPEIVPPSVPAIPNEIPELEIYDMIIIENGVGSIDQECVDAIAFNREAFTNHFIIEYSDENYKRLSKYNVKCNYSAKSSFRVKEIYRRVDEETFKRIWKAD